MNTEEALQVADKAADRNTPAADHPSIVNMVYALEILANGLRHWQEKAEAWEASSNRMARRALDATATRDRAVKALESANEELDRTQGEWSGLMEFIRTALGLSPQSLGVDERALCDKTDPRSILGQVFADARLWARVKDMANGKFVAGDVVTADALNAFNDTLAATTEPKGYTTRATPEGVWSAPAGTDPKDLSKWTRLGDLADFTLNMEFPKLTKLMAADVGQAFRKPTREPVRFEPYAPEPSERVKRVRKTPAIVTAGYASSSFTRIGKTVNGLSIWHEDAQPDATVLWGWPDVVRHGAVEIL